MRLTKSLAGCSSAK